MVVGFDLEAGMILIVETDDAGIVLEHTDAPVLGPKPATNLRRGPENGLLQQIVDAPAVKVNLAFERLVRAMLRPCLRQRFQLRVRRVAALLAEVTLDGAHLRQAEGQLSFPA